MTPRDKQLVQFAEAFFRHYYEPSHFAGKDEVVITGEAVCFLYANFDHATEMFTAEGRRGRLKIGESIIDAPTKEELADMIERYCDELEAIGRGVLGWVRKPKEIKTNDGT